MYEYIAALKERLNAQEKRMLRAIYEPQEVAVAPENAWRSLCVGEAGELRAYGAMGKGHYSEAGTRFYLRSVDCGLSWKKVIEENQAAMGQAVRSPYTGTYLTLVTSNAANEGWSLPGIQKEAPAVYALRSQEGFDDDAYTVHKVTEVRIGGLRLPFTMRTRNRWICTGQTSVDGVTHPAVMYSDDDGITWGVSIPDSAPPHVVAGHHKGLRWQNYSCEPTVCELSDGTLMMLARTSQDYHYLYYSHDGGETWTDPAPSTFHGTITQPTLRTLSDGRILLCWCNTQPLPELDHTTQWPPLMEAEIQGKADDVFTNRDANHAAISEDDGRTWIGLREMGLNGIRNDADFRSKGANDDSLDKSIHQFEILELPYNKVMVVYGQHAYSRKIVIFDLDWLYETGRSEDFRLGSSSLSTQVYLKSIAGNFRGFSGHCAWNRTHGAVLMPDPDGNFEEALLICRTDDPRLFSNVQGAVWNFPSSHAGRVKVRMRIDGDGLRLSLTDRWFNPIDWTIGEEAQVSFVIKGSQLEAGVWSDVEIVWEDASAQLWINGESQGRMEFRADAPHGLNYLHLQSTAEGPDFQGALVKQLVKE